MQLSVDLDAGAGVLLCIVWSAPMSKRSMVVSPAKEKKPKVKISLLKKRKKRVIGSRATVPISITEPLSGVADSSASPMILPR